MMSAQLLLPGLYEVNIFQNKGYDIIFVEYFVNNKMLSGDWNYTVKIDNSSISIKEVIITSMLWGFDQKNHFFEGWSWFEVINEGLSLGMTLKFFASMEKGVELKVKKYFRLSPRFVEVTGEKLVGEAFLLRNIFLIDKSDIFPYFHNQKC